MAEKGERPSLIEEEEAARRLREREIVQLRERWGEFAYWLFLQRVTRRMWAALFLLTIPAGLAGFGLLTLVEWAVDGELKIWLQSPGPWTALIVMSGLPVGLFVWFVRDRNKAYDHWLEEGRLDDEERHHQDQIVQGRIESLHTRFHQLQEWATGGVPLLRAASIHQLRPYIFSDTRVLPTEICGKNNPFVQPAMEILRALLDDRSWLIEWYDRHEKEGKKFANIPPSPTLRSIQTLLRAEGLPWRDFRSWDLSALNMSGADLNRATFGDAKMNEVHFNSAELNRAVFNEAKLKGTQFPAAKLNGVHFHWSDLDGANFSSAELNRAEFVAARLNDINLIGANLHGADFSHANMIGAKIEMKWKPVLDWEKFECAGMPDFVPDQTPGLPPPAEWDDDGDAEVDGG